jgi:hypothetical protein
VPSRPGELPNNKFCCCNSNLFSDFSQFLIKSRSAKARVSHAQTNALRRLWRSTIELINQRRNTHTRLLAAPQLESKYDFSCESGQKYFFLSYRNKGNVKKKSQNVDFTDWQSGSAQSLWLPHPVGVISVDETVVAIAERCHSSDGSLGASCYQT